jgi:predicted amidohydrolase
MYSVTKRHYWSNGKEGEVDFAGESIVVNLNGDAVTKADYEEQIIYADIRISEVAKCRNKCCSSVYNREH